MNDPALDNPTYSATVGSVEVDPHKCQHCHKQYASNAKLLQHVRNKHPEVRLEEELPTAPEDHQQLAYQHQQAVEPANLNPHQQQVLRLFLGPRYEISLRQAFFGHFFKNSAGPKLDKFTQPTFSSNLRLLAAKLFFSGKNRIK